MSGDINAALSKVTPEKSAFLVDAWRAYEGIPDVPTFKFIGALMDLEFEIVRYWFYCRSNRDGIKRAYAQSAARGSTEGIVLPALEDYHLLDKFSEDMDWNYQVPEDEIQEQEEEEPTSTSSTSGPQHQRKKLPNVASASITSKALTTIDLSEPSCNTGTRRSRAPQTLPKSTQESAEENKLTSNDDESEAEETGILGSCGTGSSRTYASSSKASRSMKRATQQSSGEVPRKRGRPLGSFKRHKNATRTKQQPPPRTPSPTPNTAEHSSSTDSSRTNTPKRYLTPVILIPRVAPRTPVVVESTSSTLPASKGSEPELEPEAESITLQPDKATKEDSSAVQKIDQADINSSQSTEPMTLSTSARTPSLAMDPIAGTDSKSKFLEQQQITGHRERRAKARTQSKGPVKAPAKIPTKAPDKAISATVSTGVATRVKSRKRKVLYQSEEEGHDDKGDNGNEDIGGGASVQLQNRPNSIGNSEAKKVEKVKAPLTIIPGSTHSFYKEFASIKPKRREKLPAQEQPPTVPLSVEIPLASTLASGAEPQQLRSLNNLAISHPLLAKPTTPTISSQVQSGDSGVQYSYSHPAIDSAEHIDPAALLEQERIASRKRDEERRIQETDKFQDFGDDLRPKEYRSNDEYWDDIRHPADEKRRIQSRRRHGSYSRGRSHSQARDRSRGQSQRRSSSPSRRRSRNKPRGRSRNQRPLILRPLTFQGVSHDRQSPPRSRNDSQQDVNACANGVPSPQLHTTRGCSFDDIRSPYSPEPFDPAVILAAAALPASEALPRLPSPFLQSHRTQSRNTHNPDDRRRFSKSEEPGANWSTTHSHRRLSQISSLEKSRSLMEIKRLPSRTVGSDLLDIDMTQVPTGPAADFFNGIVGNLQKRNYSTEANIHSHQSLPTEVYSPQVITMEISRTPPPPHPFVQPLSSDQPLHSPDFVAQHSNVRPLYHDTTQRDYFHTSRSDHLNRTASGRRLRQQRDGEDGRDHRSKSQHHYNHDHRQEEHQGLHSDRGYRGTSSQQSSYNSHYPHSSNHDNRRDDYGKRDLGTNQRLSHRNHRNGDGDRQGDYEVDTFHRSTDGSRGSKEDYSRRHSRMSRSASKSVPVGSRYGRDRSSRRPSASQDRRERDRHSYHISAPRNNKQQQDEEGVESELQNKWVDKREQDREYD